MIHKMDARTKLYSEEADGFVSHPPLWTRHVLWPPMPNDDDDAPADYDSKQEQDFPAIGFTGLQFEGQKLG